MWLSPGRSPGVPYSSKSPNAYKQKLGYGGGGECPGQGDPAPRARRINPRRCDGQCRPSGLVRGPNPEPLLGTLAWIITGKRSTFEPRGEKVSVTPVPADVPASWSPPGGVSRLRYLPALAVWQSGRGPSGSVPCDGAPSNRTSAGNDQECNEQNLLLLICGAPQQRGGVRRGRSRASGKRPHGLAHGLYLRADGADEPLFVPRGHRAPRLISVHGDGAPVT